LHVYLIDLHSQLKKKLPDAAASANTIANQLGNDPAKLEAAAMHAWQRGATEEAVLLVVDAAKHAGADGLLLANAGALLDMSGLSEKAVPILKTAVRQNPQNGMALNNLGQAYTQLGMRDSAMTYFGRCIRLSPEHPEANNTAGLIELAHGSKSKAKSYFENSIRGGFTLTAHRGLRIIDGTDTRYRQTDTSESKTPEYFNQFKYKLPAQCENVNDAVTLEKEHQDYRAFLDKLRKKYHALRLAAEKEVNANTMQNLQKRALNLEMIIRPYQILAETMLTETWIEFTKDLMNSTALSGRTVSNTCSWKRNCGTTKMPNATRRYKMNTCKSLPTSTMNCKPVTSWFIKNTPTIIFTGITSVPWMNLRSWSAITLGWNTTSICYSGSAKQKLLNLVTRQNQKKGHNRKSRS
jgi:tetratricopeptide (TPR) repeat protein